jgi:dUTP pyrophosphatase
MINKVEYEKGIRCKGMCCFCGDNTICYQGIQNTEKYGSTMDMEVLPLGAEDTCESITGTMPNNPTIGGIFMPPITIEQEKYIKELIQSELNKPLDVKIKYHDPKMPKLEKIEKGNWIDCRVIEGGTITKNLGTYQQTKESLRWENKSYLGKDEKMVYTKSIKYKKGDFMMLCLGISLNQGEGYEVNLVPRSGTFKNFHIIQTNHYGIGDDTFVGNGDIYHFPCYALADGEIELYDRVCQMRINKAMGKVNFNEVEDMEADNRGGFSSTGTK